MAHAMALHHDVLLAPAKRVEHHGAERAPPQCRRSSNADLRAATPSPGIRCPMSINPFAGKLAGHCDTWNVGAISLPGPAAAPRRPACRSLGAPSIPLGALGERESGRRIVTAVANPAVSECVVHPVGLPGSDPLPGKGCRQGRAWVTAADRGPIRCVKIGANGSPPRVPEPPIDQESWWQSQSGRCNSPGRDATGRTVDPTRPAAMVQGGTRRTGAVSLLIRRLQVRVLPGAQTRRSAA
jgi:hypothetical protein